MLIPIESEGETGVIMRAGFDGCESTPGFWDLGWVQIVTTNNTKGNLSGMSGEYVTYIDRSKASREANEPYLLLLPSEIEQEVMCKNPGMEKYITAMADRANRLSNTDIDWHATLSLFNTKTSEVYISISYGYYSTLNEVFDIYRPILAPTQSFDYFKQLKR